MRIKKDKKEPQENTSMSLSMLTGKSARKIVFSIIYTRQSSTSYGKVEV